MIRIKHSVFCFVFLSDYYTGIHLNGKERKLRRQGEILQGEGTRRGHEHSSHTTQTAGPARAPAQHESSRAEAGPEGLGPVGRGLGC